MPPERNPQQTRQRILDAALEEMHHNGFQGMRVDKVLEKTQSAKGALYHHFATKQELAYAVVDELLYAYIENRWVKTLADCGDSLEQLKSILQNYYDEEGDSVVRYGCPLINLSQEMPSLDDGFRNRLFAIFNMWIGSIQTSLESGQRQKQVKADLDPEVAAGFIVTSFVGINVAVKCTQSKEKFYKMTGALKDYVEGLRAS